MRRFGYAVLVVIVAAMTGCGSSGTPEARSSASAGTCATGLPGDGPPAPPLPTDRPVGRGTLIYQPCPDCAFALVTEAGERYSVSGVTEQIPGLPPPPAPPTAPLPDASPRPGPTAVPIPLDPVFSLRLSPDGRWLAQLGYHGSVLRDLTSTEVRQLGRGVPKAWSADGRFLVVFSYVPDTNTSATELVEVATGKRRPVRLPWGDVLAVFGPDEVLVARGYDGENRDPEESRETYAVVDPATGAVRREITVDAGGPTLSRYEAVAMGNLLVGATAPTNGRPKELIAIAVDTGRVLGRHRLPADAPYPYDFWRVRGISGGQVVLEHRVDVGSPTPHAEPVQLFLMDPVTGERRPSCTLPASSEVIVPS